MTKEELLNRLKSVEWDDIEFKKASREAPRYALRSVSAFANTKGGHLVFGVSEANGTFTITGVIEVDKVQSELWGKIRDDKKISVRLPVVCDLHEFTEGAVICFHIPEATRKEKPVYLNGDLKQSYVRRGASNYLCSRNELMRFLRDAGNTEYDSELLDLDPETFFDKSALKLYRKWFDAKNHGEDEELSDIDFLRQWALVRERNSRLHPTRAAVLLFGSKQYVRSDLSRVIVDLQLYRCSEEDHSAEAGWDDRLVLETNLITAWQEMVNFYRRVSEMPFAIDPATLQRKENPPDYIAFREAAINLLIHQDFGDSRLKPVIRFYSDCIEFFNPGDAPATKEQLLDHGDIEVRNPRIVNAFRRAGLAEQGGIGIPAIFRNWRRLGYFPPEIENNKADNRFRLRLYRKYLLNEDQLLAQASLGADLSEREGAVFAFLIRKGEADMADIKALTGLTGPAVPDLVQRLITQRIMKQVGETKKFVIADHLRDRFWKKKSEAQVDAMISSNAQDTNNVRRVADTPDPLRGLSKTQWAIVEHTDVPCSTAKLMRVTGHKQRARFRKEHLRPLITGGIVKMTEPDKPTSPTQSYVLTDAGLKLKTLGLARGRGSDE